MQNLNYDEVFMYRGWMNVIFCAMNYLFGLASGGAMLKDDKLTCVSFGSQYTL